MHTSHRRAKKGSPIVVLPNTKHGDAKLERLRALKRAWDPTNVFHLNHNVEP